MIKRDNGKNTCLTDCVAYIFNLNANDVPFFIKNKFWLSRSLKWWLKKRGYKYKLIEDAEGVVKNREKYIAIGKSPRSKAKSNNKYDRRILTHAVVCKNSKIIFDPAPVKKGIVGKSLYYLVFEKIVENFLAMD
jgi:hypothetical protein